MRVELRHWRVADAEALARAIEESLEHLRPWMPWAADEPTPVPALAERIRGWETEHLAGGDENLGVWVGGEAAGSCGLHRRIAPGGLELGYWIHPRHVRRGLATEVARQLCERAFADPATDRVEIHHDRANVASGRIPARLGFEHVGDERRPPEAPAEEGVERVWRLTRAAYGRRPARS